VPHLSLALAAALVAGLTAGVLSDLKIALAGSIALSGAWTAAVLGYRLQRPRLLLAALVVAVVVVGGLLGQHAVDRAIATPLRAQLEQLVPGFAIDAPDDARLEEPVTIEGRLRADATLTDRGASLFIETTRLIAGERPWPTAGGVAIGVGGAVTRADVSRWRRGTMVRAPVLLRRPARYLDAGLGDQERALARRGTTLVGVVKSASLVEIAREPWWWDRAAAAVRARTRDALERHVRPLAPQSAAIATAILTGERGDLSADIERRLQEAGTYHVIAISGGNIAVIAGTLLIVLGALGLRGALAVSAVIGGVAGYAWMAEGGASVARAALMAAIYLAVRLIDQRTTALNAIGLAATAILLVSPLAVTDVGFWLTFGATAAIVAGTERALTNRRGWQRALLAVALSSVAAEVALAPVSALVFQRVTLAGLALNFVALPAMTVVQLSAMAVVAADLLSQPGLAAALGAAAHAGCVVLTTSARLVDLAPWLTWRVPPPGLTALAAYYMSLAAAALSFHLSAARARRLAVSAAAASFLWIVAAPAAHVRAFGDGRLHVTMFDVGQGDALLVVFPDGRRLVVDTGGAGVNSEFDIGDRVLGPALRARGIVSLDYLAVTHGDPDHVGGALSLLREFAPREIWWGVPVAGHQPAERLQAEAARVRAAWRTLQRGDLVAIGGVDLRVHHPPPPDWERRRVRNDDSLVLELVYGSVSVVLTGDVGTEVEQSLVPLLAPRPLVVLKVPHHGSATSSSAPFLERLRPAVALIGVGRANAYGHPVPAVLDRLHAAGARVFRTDRDGQIDVVTDGHTVSVETFTGTRYRK
jgi:competence protein ComEC